MAYRAQTLPLPRRVPLYPLRLYVSCLFCSTERVESGRLRSDKGVCFGPIQRSYRGKLWPRSRPDLDPRRRARAALDLDFIATEDGWQVWRRQESGTRAVSPVRRHGKVIVLSGSFKWAK